MQNFRADQYRKKIIKNKDKKKYKIEWWIILTRLLEIQVLIKEKNSIKKKQILKLILIKPCWKNL